MSNERHEAFARAVVALARQYRISSVAMQYRDSSRGIVVEGEYIRPDDYLDGQFHLSWAEGRHGDPNCILVERREIVSIKEKP